MRPVQRSNEIYERHLMLKGRGFQLWIPQPNMRLPIPYRAKGVCIGDVGVVKRLVGLIFCLTYVERETTQSTLENFLINSPSTIPD